MQIKKTTTRDTKKSVKYKNTTKIVCEGWDLMRNNKKKDFAMGLWHDRLYVEKLIKY